MNRDKYTFLKEAFTPLLKTLKSNTKGKWGVMNAQQMVEHFTEYVRMSSGVIKSEAYLTGEKSLRSKAFMMSDAPFKENTPNPLMPDLPPEVHNPDMASAIPELEEALGQFFKNFEENPGLVTMSPFFGELNYEENIQLLHKHAIHHLKQFGLA